MLKRTKILAALLAGSTVLAALPAASATMTVKKTFSNTFGPTVEQRWFETTKYVAGTTTRHVYAGAFRLTGTTADSTATNFLAFCLQPLENLTLPLDYEMGSNFTATVNANLNILASNAWDQVKDSQTAAAFQMAAWEITTELTANAFNINTGNFQVISTEAKSVSAANLAQQWLDNIETIAWSQNTNEFLVLNATGTQDLLTNVQAVPVPAAGVLMLGGLVA